MKYGFEVERKNGRLEVMATNDFYVTGFLDYTGAEFVAWVAPECGLEKALEACAGREINDYDDDLGYGLMPHDSLFDDEDDEDGGLPEIWRLVETDNDKVGIVIINVSNTEEPRIFLEKMSEEEIQEWLELEEE